MKYKADYVKLKTGRSLKERKSLRPSAESIIRQKLMRTQTGYDLRVISPDIFFSEEQRPNIHVIGSSRQGKSYFIEWLMREDIDRGLGCCLLDPSAGGSTAYRLLAYCAEQQKQNVLFIDPAHAYSPHKKVASLRPFQYDRDGAKRPQLRQLSVDTLMRAIRDLYSVKDPAEQSRIERYLPLVFAALYDAEAPLIDARYFTSRKYQEAQAEILSYTSDDIQAELKEALSSYAYNINFQSTVSRLLRFVRGQIGPMFASTRGIDWTRVVREHWAVIVRLDNLDTFDARLLGTYIISQLEAAKERLGELMDRGRDFAERGTYPPFYLYADEAYLFASRSLKNILDLKQKLNFKVTLAHHAAKQFDDPAVYASIKTNCDMTVLFYVRGRDDRDDIASEMYGGDINPKDASYANSNLPKQHAVIRLGKEPPKRVRLSDVPTPDISKEELTGYTIDCYHRLTEVGWYRDSDAEAETTYEPRRAKDTHQRTAPPRTPAASKTNRKSRVPDGKDYTRKFQTLSCNLPSGQQHAAADGGPEGD
jgi:hypothetical protein